MTQMPHSVLEPVKRRRRRRSYRWPAALGLLLVAGIAGAGALLTGHAFRTHRASAAAATAAHAMRPAVEPLVRRVRPAPKPEPPPKLVSTGPALSHARLDISAHAAILVDGATGRVLWARHPRQRHQIASTTKIMTAILALQRVKLGSYVKIGPEVPRVEPNREGLRVGEKVKAWKLFYGLLLYSGNDDALALAIAAGGTRAAFIADMNAKARALGMRHTHFASPSGVVDVDNHSTAWDMAVLARYAMQDSRFRQIVRTRRMEVKWAKPTYAKVYLSKNALLGTYPGANGIKTGWTTIARHCLVASAKRGHRKLIAVVLHSDDAFADGRRLLDLGFRLKR